MLAVLQTRAGDASTLYLGETARPQPGPGQLLLRVHAVGINRADIVQREGRYPAPAGASPLLGLEVSGEVVEVGAGVSGFAPGEAVFGLVGGGGYAEYAMLDASCALRKPDNLSHAEAASLPEAWMTAWFNLIELGQLKANEQVLIHAGASGVGAAAIQLARLHGAQVACTVGSAAKAAFCRGLGAQRAIEYHRQDFACELKAQGGVDLILDCVGARYLDANLHSLRSDGRLIVIGLMGGANAPLDLGRLLVKRLSLRGSTLRAQPEVVKARLSAALRDTILPALTAGQLKLTLDRTFPLAEVRAAHAWLEGNHNLGKLVLTLA